MKKFRIEVVSTQYGWIEVEASDMDEAIIKAEILDGDFMCNHSDTVAKDPRLTSQ